MKWSSVKTGEWNHLCSNFKTYSEYAARIIFTTQFLFPYSPQFKGYPCYQCRVTHSHVFADGSVRALRRDGNAAGPGRAQDIWASSCHLPALWGFLLRFWEYRSPGRRYCYFNLEREIRIDEIVTWTKKQHTDLLSLQTKSITLYFLEHMYQGQGAVLDMWVGVPKGRDRRAQWDMRQSDWRVWNLQKEGFLEEFTTYSLQCTILHLDL